MFKKLKDKITEEVKSSPQRIQQFAQAAQAAVTSASSSISDISNNDLFSIADDETPQNSPLRPGFRDVSLNQSPSQTNRQSPDKRPNAAGANQSEEGTIANMSTVYPPPSRLRRLSNSSNASDVSFRLPSYETPGSMYHLQSDLDVSASEMEDNMSVPAQLERVSKEHLYAAYRRTNEKYNKYRGRYTDLARHYRNLERENVKARAVLVETQDKALRRISELREQCSLEQSAKAHLENALRLELDERNLKMEALNTKIKLLQSYSSGQPQLQQPPLSHSTESQTQPQQSIPDSHFAPDRAAMQQSLPSTNGELVSTHAPAPPLAPLIDFSTDQSDTGIEPRLEELQAKHSAEMHVLNNKMQKLEQLLVKCKDTIKSHKEKNGQLTTEIQIVSAQLDKKNADSLELEARAASLDDVLKELEHSKDQISQYKSELDTFEAKKAEDISKIQTELDSARESVRILNGDVDVLNKREEENVISLAENKLSVHKELETKEKEIVVLKNSIAGLMTDLDENRGVVVQLNSKIATLEEESVKINIRLSDFEAAREQIGDLEGKIVELRSQNGDLDAKCASLLENIKCNELQLKQEADEKLALMDRNNFLEGRNKHLGDENAKKNKHVSKLEKEIMDIGKDTGERNDLSEKYQAVMIERNTFKADYEGAIESREALENEINKINAKSKELENRLSQVTSESDRLKAELEDRAVEVQRSVSQLEMNEGRHKEVCVELNALKQEYTKKCDDVNSLERKLSETAAFNECQETESVQNVRIEMKEKLDALRLEMTKKYDEKLTEFEKLRESHGIVDEELTRSRETMSEFEKMKESHDRLNEELNRNKENLSEFQKLQDIYEKLNSELSQNREKLSEFEKLKENHDKLNEEINQNREKLTELETLKRRHDELNNELSHHKEKLIEFENLKKEMSQLKERLSESHLKADEMKQVDEEYSKLVKEKNRSDSKLQSCSAELEISKNECIQLTTDKTMLETKVSALEAEKEEVNRKTGAMVEDIQQLQAALSSVQESHSHIVTEKSRIEARIFEMEHAHNQKRDESHSEMDKKVTENEYLQKRLQILQEEKGKVIDEKDELAKKVNEQTKRLESLETIVKECSDKDQVWQQKLSDILDENNSLREKGSKLKRDRETIGEKIALLELRIAESDAVRPLLEEARLEKEFLNLRVTQLETDLRQSGAENESVQRGLNEKCEDVVKLKVELKEMSSVRDALQSKFDEECAEKEKFTEQLRGVTDAAKNLESIAEQKGALEDKISRLQEKFSSDEKINTDRIEKLTESNCELSKEIEVLRVKGEGVDEVSRKNDELTAETDKMTARIQILEQIAVEHSQVQEELHGLRCEKSKLVSDVEGLQTHLAKVSADNGQLSDRLREAIADGEVVRTTRLQSLEALPDASHNEDFSGRIADLERQNSILVEEKLELEDQIKSSMERHSGGDNERELETLRAEQRRVAEDRAELERRATEYEALRRTGEGGLRALERSNEKLRLANEKLERRLDEALVSLGHIRTLEENTELEYLRNILYEYLTGPASNNMVLAKVLAAVVKFDQRQTHLVMQREKERQGVLGQLGLL